MMIETIGLILAIIVGIFTIILKWPEVKAHIHRLYFEQKSKSRRIMGNLELDKEYTLKLNERYRFDHGEIELTSIWDDSIDAAVKFKGQIGGIRVKVGCSEQLFEVIITLVKVNYNLKKEKIYAVIKIKRVC